MLTLFDIEYQNMAMKSHHENEDVSVGIDRDHRVGIASSFSSICALPGAVLAVLK